MPRHNKRSPAKPGKKRKSGMAGVKSRSRGYSQRGHKR